MKKFRFLDHDLAGDIYYDPQRKEWEHAGVFLFGLPAFIGPNDVTKSFLKAGLLAFQPHYFGTYDSGGVFSPDSIIRTCEITQKLFDRGQVSNLKTQGLTQLPSHLSVCVGHSFGSLVALRGAASLHDIQLLILLGPTVHYRRSEPDFGNTADGPKSMDYVRLSHRHTYRVASEDEWRPLLTGDEDLPVSNNHPSLKNVIFVVGEHDSYVDISALERTHGFLVDAYCGHDISREFIVIKGGQHTVDYLCETPEFDLASRIQDTIQS